MIRFGKKKLFAPVNMFAMTIFLAALLLLSCGNEDEISTANPWNLEGEALEQYNECYEGCQARGGDNARCETFCLAENGERERGERVERDKEERAEREAAERR